MSTCILLTTLNFPSEKKALFGLYENLKNNYRNGINESDEPVLSLTPAELFAACPDYATFKKELIKLQGDFLFEVQDMIELGKAYFKKYPDNFNASTPEEIQIGYRTARICLIEKIIKDIPQNRKHYYRKMYYKPAEIHDITEHIIQKYGREKINDDFLLFSANLNKMFFKIDDIPRSMIKERYAGGISIFFNLAYLLERSIKMHMEPVMQ